MKRGRPRKYSEEFLESFRRELAESGLSLRSFCCHKKVPYRSMKAFGFKAPPRKIFVRDRKNDSPRAIDWAKCTAMGLQRHPRNEKGQFINAES